MQSVVQVLARASGYADNPPKGSMPFTVQDRDPVPVYQVQGFEQGRQHPVWSPFRRLSSARMIGIQALDQLLRCDGRQAHGPPAAVARHDIEHPFQPDSGSQRGGWVVIASRCAAGVVDRQQGRRLDRSTGAAGAMSGQQVTGSTITRDGRAALISSHNRGQASHRVTAPQLSGSV